MRTVRIAPPPSTVGADLRAALISWGHTDRVLGGVALLGCQPAGSPRPVDAVVITAHTTIVVVSVDLPAPTLRLEAPLAGPWLSDGWSLPADGASVNPAIPALRCAQAVADLLRAAGHGDSGIVIAVGPYAEEIVQPPADTTGPVRLCYPQPDTLLTIVRSLAGTGPPVPPRPATDVARMIASLAPGCAVPGPEQLIAEGFPENVAAPAQRREQALPTVPRLPQPATPPQAVAPAPGRNWAGPVAIALAVLLLTGTVLAIVLSGGDAQPQPQPATTARPAQVINGQRFRPEASARDGACAPHAYGDVHVALTRHPCVALLRAGFASAVGGRAAAVSVAALRFPDGDAAQAFLRTARQPGSGGINSLLAEGRRWHGAPRSFDGAAYLVRSHGNEVRFTAATWVGSAANSDDPALRTLASDAQQLRLRSR